MNEVWLTPTGSLYQTVISHTLGLLSPPGFLVVSAVDRLRGFLMSKIRLPPLKDPQVAPLFGASLRAQASTGGSQATPSGLRSGVQFHHPRAPPAPRHQKANTAQARSGPFPSRMASPPFPSRTSRPRATAACSRPPRCSLRRWGLSPAPLSS